jgi:hypothetical protein
MGSFSTQGKATRRTAPPLASIIQLDAFIRLIRVIRGQRPRIADPAAAPRKRDGAAGA